MSQDCTVANTSSVREKVNAPELLSFLSPIEAIRKFRRYKNPINGKHVYTTNPSFNGSGYVDEGSVGSLYMDDDEGVPNLMPLYLYYQSQVRLPWRDLGNEPSRLQGLTACS